MIRPFHRRPQRRPLTLALALSIGAIVLAALSQGCTRQATPAAPAPAAQVETVRVGYVNILSNAPAVIADREGLFARHGLQAEVKPFATGPVLYRALAAKQVDIAYAGIPALTNWAAQGLPVKVVAKVDDGRFLLITRGDSPVRQVTDLRGRTVGSTGRGSGGDLLLRGFLLKEAGLAPDRDVTIADLQSSTLEGALDTGSVQAAFLGEPFASYALLRGKRAVADAPDPALVVVVRDELLRDRPEVVRRFLRAHLAAIERLNQSPQETNQVLAAAFQFPAVELEGRRYQPSEVIATARQRMRFDWRFAESDFSYYQSLADAARELGYVKQRVAVRGLFDLRLLAEVQP